MKKLIPTILGLMAFGCGQTDHSHQTLEARVDRLEKRMAHVYQPGLGEFMSSVQTHHAKLWFAGQNENWKLADFEMHEIEEAIAAIQTVITDRPEVKMTEMLTPGMDSVRHAIEKQDPVNFRSSFTFLTQTCNQCHRATQFEFNVVKVPQTSPFSNQEFRVGEK